MFGMKILRDVFSDAVALDLGTVNTLAAIKGRGIVLREPSAVAVSTGEDREIVEIGSKAMLMLGLISSTVLVGAILLFGHNIIGWFTQTELTMQLGVQGLNTLAVGYICFSVSQVLQGTMRGAGETKVPMYISIVTTVILRMPLAYLLAALTKNAEWPNGQPAALFVSLLVSWVVAMLLSILSDRMRFWRRKLGSLGDEL